MLLRRAGDVKHRKRVRLGKNLSRRRHLRGHPTKPGPREARKLGEAPHTVLASPLHVARKGRGLRQVVSRPLR